MEIDRIPFAMFTVITWTIWAPFVSLTVRVSVKLCGVVKRPTEKMAWLSLKDHEVPEIEDPETVALLTPVPLTKAKV